MYLVSAKQTRVQSRVDNVEMFSRQLLARCDMSDDQGTPLKPLSYIGYAAGADQRKRQHEACGSSSNWLATLVQAICNVLWGQGRFQMHFMVVCLLSSDGQGMIAEMLLTRIAGAYYNVGGGFCIDVAGKSMESLHFASLTHHQNVDKWNELSEWNSINTSLDGNRTECIRKMHDKRQRQTAARIAKTESVIAETKRVALKLYARKKLWSSTMEKYPDDPGLRDNGEVRSLAAKFIHDFEALRPSGEDSG